MSVLHFDINQLRKDLGIFDSAIEKLAFTPQGPPPPPMTAGPPPGAPPMGPDGQPMPPMGPDGQPLPPEAAGMPPGGAPPMGPDGQPMPPDGGAPPMGPDGQPMPPDGGMPPAGGVDPQLEGMLAQLADGVTGMGNEVQSQREQIDQLTRRLLQMEQQMSSFQDGLKAPAPIEASTEAVPSPGKPL